MIKCVQKRPWAVSLQTQIYLNRVDWDMFFCAINHEKAGYQERIFSDFLFTKVLVNGNV